MVDFDLNELKAAIKAELKNEFKNDVDSDQDVKVSDKDVNDQKQYNKQFNYNVIIQKQYDKFTSWLKKQIRNKKQLKETFI